MLRGSLQGTQTLGPEHLERCPKLGDGLGSCTVQTLRALAPLRHQACLLQDAEVLGDRRPRDIEPPRDVADRELLAGNQAKDLAASGLTKGCKCVDFLRVSACLLKVKTLGGFLVTDSRPNHDPTGRYLARRLREASHHTP